VPEHCVVKGINRGAQSVVVFWAVDKHGKTTTRIKTATERAALRPIVTSSDYSELNIATRRPQMDLRTLSLQTADRCLGRAVLIWRRGGPRLNGSTVAFGLL
jgi:hypothetical protein